MVKTCGYYEASVVCTSHNTTVLCNSGTSCFGSGGPCRSARCITITSPWGSHVATQKKGWLTILKMRICPAFILTPMPPILNNPHAPNPKVESMGSIHPVSKHWGYCICESVINAVSSILPSVGKLHFYCADVPPSWTIHRDGLSIVKYPSKYSHSDGIQDTWWVPSFWSSVMIHFFFGMKTKMVLGNCSTTWRITLLQKSHIMSNIHLQLILGQLHAWLQCLSIYDTQKLSVLHAHDWELRIYKVTHWGWGF